VREVESTAQYEAGHAVAAVHQGRAVKTVTIVEDGDAYGRVTHHPIGVAPAGYRDQHPHPGLP
jgi:ATP-dependent Zn protease